jgi:hypothetical protein
MVVTLSRLWSVVLLFFIFILPHFVENVKYFFPSFFLAGEDGEKPVRFLPLGLQEISRRPVSSHLRKSIPYWEHPYYTTGFGVCQGVFQTFTEVFLNLAEAECAVSTALFLHCAPPWNNYIIAEFLL